MRNNSYEARSTFRYRQAAVPSPQESRQWSTKPPSLSTSYSPRHKSNFALSVLWQGQDPYNLPWCTSCYRKFTTQATGNVYKPRVCWSFYYIQYRSLDMVRPHCPCIGLQLMLIRESLIHKLQDRTVSNTSALRCCDHKS